MQVTSSALISSPPRSSNFCCVSDLDCDPELASSILSVMTGCCNKLSSFEKSKMKGEHLICQ